MTASNTAARQAAVSIRTKKTRIAGSMWVLGLVSFSVFAAPLAERDLQSQSTYRLIRSLERPSNPSKGPILWELAQRQTPSALSALLHTLADPNPAVRRAAAQGLNIRLQRTGFDKAWVRAQLLRHAHNSDRLFRAQLGQALAQIGPPRANEPASSSPEIRDLRLHWTVESSARDPSRRALGAGLADDSSEVRQSAIELIVARRELGFGKIIAELACDAEGAEAELAVKALNSLPAAHVYLRTTFQCAPTKTALLAHNSIRERHRHPVDLLVPALSAMDPVKRRPLLTRAVTSSTDTDIQDLLRVLGHPVRARAALALQWLAQLGPRADDAMALAMVEASPTQAELIRRHLNTRPAHGVSTRLRTLALHEEKAVRAVGLLLPPSEKGDLLPLLESPRPELLVAAMEAVRDVPGARPKLLELAAASDARVRAGAIRALAHHKGRDAWKSRLRAFTDPSEVVRIATIKSFSGSSLLSAIQRLERRVTEGTARERRAALEALQRSRSTRAAVALIEFVAHPNYEVRHAALSLLQ